MTEANLTLVAPGLSFLGGARLVAGRLLPVVINLIYLDIKAGDTLP